MKEARKRGEGSRVDLQIAHNTSDQDGSGGTDPKEYNNMSQDNVVATTTRKGKGEAFVHFRDKQEEDAARDEAKKVIKRQKARRQVMRKNYQLRM